MIHPVYRSILLGFVIVLFAAILSGCFIKRFDIRSPSGSANATKAKFEPVQDVPIPSNSKLDNDRSLILNTADKWTGRIVLEAEPPMSKLFAYYGAEMRKLGWTPVARVMGQTSVLTFVRGERVVTVQITPNMMSEGSVVTVTMSPRDPQHYSDVVPVARETEGSVHGNAIPAYRQEYRPSSYVDSSVQADQLPPASYPTQTSTRYRR
jgi:hypothetical protein